MGDGGGQGGEYPRTYKIRIYYDTFVYQFYFLGPYTKTQMGEDYDFMVMI